MSRPRCWSPVGLETNERKRLGRVEDATMQAEAWKARGTFHTLNGHSLFAVDTDPDR